LIYTPLAQEAIEEWRKPPWAAYYHESGLLSIAPADNPNSYVKGSIQKQKEFYGELPPHVHVLDDPEAIRAAARTKAPLGTFEGLEGCLNTASGWVWARGAMDELARILRESGIQITQGEVTKLLVCDGDVRGVKTAAGDVEADLTILAGGGWSASLVPELGNLLLANGQALASIHLTDDEAELYSDIPVSRENICCPQSDLLIPNRSS
jgi:sarcosine oxidase / L-pipecolate oxidase